MGSNLTELTKVTKEESEFTKKVYKPLTEEVRKTDCNPIIRRVYYEDKKKEIQNVMVILKENVEGNEEYKNILTGFDERIDYCKDFVGKLDDIYLELLALAQSIWKKECKSEELCLLRLE